MIVGKRLGNCYINRFCNIKKGSQQTEKRKQQQTELKNYGGIEAFMDEKRRMSKDYLNKYNSTVPDNRLRNYYRQHLVELTLYMSHDEWKSQYIYAILNYQKLGFRPVSDYVFLDSALYTYDLKKVTPNQRWPLLRFSMPVQEPTVIRGHEQIYRFLASNNLFRYDVQKDIMSETMEKYIEQAITPHLESLFWHPRLTFEYSFHTNLTSYQHNMINYSLIGIFYRNIFLCLSRTFKNLIKIYKNKQQYLHSKQNLTKGLRQIEKMIEGKQFIGGSQPNHVDFYLFALLNTKMNSRLFENYLRNEVKGEFWSWNLRMRSLTQYDKERVTLM